MEAELTLDRGAARILVRAGFQDRVVVMITTTRLGAVRVKGDEIHRTR